MDDLAIDVLELNLVVFPAHLDSYLFLAKIHLQKDDRAGAESVLEKALVVGPGDTTITNLLADIQQKG